MKALLSIFISTLFLPYNLLSQETFSKQIHFPKTTDVGWKVISEEDGYIISSSATFYTDTGFYFADRLLRIDLQLELEWVKLIDSIPKRTNIGNINGMISTQDSSYLLNGTTSSQGEFLNQGLILKLDAQGDTVWYQIYDDELELREVPILSYELESGNTLTLGWKNNLNAPSSFFLLKYTPDGTLLWDKIIPVDCPLKFAHNMVPTEDGNFLFSYQCYQSNNEFPGVMKIDSMGNVLWDKNWEELASYCWTTGGTVQTLPNGGYAFVYCTPKWNGQGDTTRVYGMNANHEQIWDVPIVDHSVNNLVSVASSRKAANGDIILCGFNDAHPDYNSAGYFARISPEGELLWQRFFVLADRPWDYPQLYNFEILPDGGFIATGFLLDSIDRSDIWLFKLDEDGCFTPGCTEEIIYISKYVSTDEIIQDLQEVFFQLSPNPTTHIAHLNFYNPIQRENALLKVYSMNGQLMYRKVLSKGVQDIDLEVVDYPSGLYLVSLEWEGRVLQREKLVKQ
jgi:hypothetical protein